MYDVMKYVHDHIRERMAVTDVAAMFGYSKWHFCKKFHDFTGMTFLEYVRHYRIQLAAIDILQGDTVTDVAFRYSYDTVGGFNKAFLTHYGCLPRKYRERAEACRLYYEKRRMSMYPLTDRCLFLREEAMNHKQYLLRYCVQHNVYFALGRAAALEAGRSRTEAIAEGIVRVVNSFTPVIIPGELIVGFNYGDGVYGEYVIPGDDPVGRELMDKNRISEADRAAFWALDPVYYGEPDENHAVLSTEEIWALQEWAGIGRCICANHTVLGYEKVLKLGFEGILAEIRHYEAINGTSEHYTAMKTLCSAACILGEKYADEAERLLATEEDPLLKEAYISVAKVCRRVPRHPAESFTEAVQALWFAHILNTWEDKINANSIGRLDQILYPYYKADIDKGILTREEAFEIICCLWVKLYRDYDVQQSCVGGTNPDGTSAVN
ncbi:MAG: helix-turn-helix domain-containing protein, partial [Clostridia bacterium]|nr:helix-turn-helix domain-containing protein [Clostridia bacterium]